MTNVPLFGVAVAGADRWIAAGCDDGRVKLWQPQLGVALGIEAPMLEARGHEERVVGIAFAPRDAAWRFVFIGGQTLYRASIGDELPVQLWTPEPEDDVALLAMHGLAVSPPGTHAALGIGAAVVEIDLAEREPVWHRVHTAEVNAVAYLARGSIASVADDGRLVITDRA